jgi:hypothetical protein
MTRRRQGAKMKEICAQSRACENRIIRFEIPEYPIFPGEIESDYDLKFSLFKEDLRISKSKRYVMLPI